MFAEYQKAWSAKRCIITTCALSTTLTRGSQKAPSAKRYIKTRQPLPTVIAGSWVRKHQAPKGALRRRAWDLHAIPTLLSESTERHKVH